MDEQPITLPGLTPREAALDAYYRLAWALDNNDWKLFESGWADEPHFILEDLDLKGLEAIRSRLFDVTSKQDTQHISSNARVYLEPETKQGKIWVMALNQHFRQGDGAKPETSRLWGGNQYQLDIVEENGLWKVKKWTVKLGWFEGDLSIVGR